MKNKGYAKFREGKQGVLREMCKWIYPSYIPVKNKYGLPPERTFSSHP